MGSVGNHGRSRVLSGNLRSVDLANVKSTRPEGANLFNITCFPLGNADYATGTNEVELLGTVKYGVGGFQAESVDFDIGRGVRFQLAADWVRVSARLVRDADPPTDFRVGAYVSEGNISPRHALTRTVKLTLAGGATSRLVDVPPMSRALTIMSDDPANHGFVVAFEANTGGSTVKALVGAGEGQVPILIPGANTASIELTNTTAQSRDVWAIYHLDL